jgi:hypothetical protein
VTSPSEKTSDQRLMVVHFSSLVPNQCPHIEENLELVPPYILILRLARGPRHIDGGRELAPGTPFENELRSFHAMPIANTWLRNWSCSCEELHRFNAAPELTRHDKRSDEREPCVSTKMRRHG